MLFVMRPASSTAFRFEDAEWGVVKVLPYKAHLAIDAVTGVAALAAPWMFVR
jgi:hypothetical protein